MKTDYVAVTEVSGDDVTAEQVDRLARRYFWAGAYCVGKDVLELACGAAQGAGYLAARARSLICGDVSPALLDVARAHYGDRIDLRELDAQDLSEFADASFDVVLLFEALYYIPDLGRLFSEVARVLRPGGAFLVATANKDLFDFNPSPHSHRYLGVRELHEELGRRGFEVRCFGDTPVEAVSARQRLLRPVKAVAARLGLIPKSMGAKKLLKRFVFGNLVSMPAEITDETATRRPPVAVPGGQADRAHKVIYCAARLA